MNTIPTDVFDPDFGKTLSFYTRKGLHGYYDPGQSWEVYLNVEEIRSAGLYDEIYVHEHTHHQLMCSSAFGHAQQMAAQLTLRMERFRPLAKALMDISWGVHEGAAMLAGFHAHCAESVTSQELQALNAEGCDMSIYRQIQAKLEREYLTNYHKKYEEPFRIFNGLRNTMFPPTHYATVTSVFANAVGQFAFNTDILPRLSAFLDGEKSLSSEYFNAVHNHPGMRLLKLHSAVAADIHHACAVLAETQKDKISLLLSHGISFDESGVLELDPDDHRKSALVFDWFNNVFLEWACRISGLTVVAFHSRDIARQFDDLCHRNAAFIQAAGLPSGRIDVSAHPDRWLFTPRINDISKK
jgi:hypothetical protein